MLGGGQEKESRVSEREDEGALWPSTCWKKMTPPSTRRKSSVPVFLKP
jgi:hypothetical protein